MDLSEVITPERIAILEERFENKQELLERLFNRCCGEEDFGGKRAEVWRSLLEREKSMSTGIGLGVAIPHCSSDYVPDVLAYAAVLRQGVEFQAVDEAPVQIIVLLLMPKKKFERHIKILAAIARQFNDEGIRRRVLQAADAAEAYGVIAESAASPRGS
ncbi:MAG: PTS sugar transporter subunit IIA [Leptospirales bacterium]|nr:PTS sugar transporter subunit IIA [Leptospirales bacterium]